MNPAILDFQWCLFWKREKGKTPLAALWGGSSLEDSHYVYESWKNLSKKANIWCRFTIKKKSAKNSRKVLPTWTSKQWPVLRIWGILKTANVSHTTVLKFRTPVPDPFHGPLPSPCEHRYITTFLWRRHILMMVSYETISHDSFMKCLSFIKTVSIDPTFGSKFWSQTSLRLPEFGLLCWIEKSRVEIMKRNIWISDIYFSSCLLLRLFFTIVWRLPSGNKFLLPSGKMVKFRCIFYAAYVWKNF